MTKKFKSLLTDKGKALIADAIAGGKTISLKYFAVGDGNGSEVTPSTAQTALVNEVARIELNSVKETDANKTTVAAEAIIPADKGGFWIREAGIFTADGVLVAVSQMPVTYKPDTDDGATSTQTLRMLLAVSDASAISLTVDDSLIIATEAFVNEAIEAHAKSRNHPDASLTEKGFVQLSSKTNSDDEDKAATPKAVKAANGNAEKRLEKENNLSDVTDTAKALANIGGVPATRKINGHPLTDDANVTAQDIFNGQAVAIGDAVDLNTLTTPGLYYQTANVQAQSGQNYPEPAAGSLEVYKHAGITQVYRIYANSGTYIRTLYNGTWSAWTIQYDAVHKPAPADIGAVPASGGSVAYLDNATYYKTNPAGWYGGGAFADQYRNNAAPFLVPYGFASVKGTSQYLPIVKGISHTEGWGYGAAVSFGILRSGNADFGSAVINVIGDNGNTAIYSFDVNGTFNAPGQLYSGGTISAAGQISNSGNIVAGQGLYESGGTVRVYSPNNPPPQQDLSPYATTSWVTGNFYSAAQSDARFPTAFRVGARVQYNGPDYDGHVPQGAVNINNQTLDDDRINGVTYAYLQFYLNGNWYNFS
ncbi:phage tail-collar fiber domain-containing protein [Enterobacter asburiae]